MGIELFERAAETEARLLKAEQLVEQGSDPSPEQGIGYLLTFDVGRILILPDSQNASLALREIKNAADLDKLPAISCFFMMTSYSTNRSLMLSRS